MEINNIKELHNKYGCGFLMAKKAIEYCNTHKNCTPDGYIKAKTYAVYWNNFDKKVLHFSKEE